MIQDTFNYHINTFNYYAHTFRLHCGIKGLSLRNYYKFSSQKLDRKLKKLNHKKLIQILHYNLQSRLRI